MELFPVVLRKILPPLHSQVFFCPEAGQQYE